MIKEITVIRPKKALAPNGHHSEIIASFNWTKPTRKAARTA